MSLVGLLDHVVTVYRPALTKSGPGVVEAYSAVTGLTSVGAAVQRADVTMRNAGAGDVEAGSHRIFMDSGVDVRQRDVVSVTGGPEASVKLRVLSVTKPRGHHTEIIGEVWEGTLP